MKTIILTEDEFSILEEFILTDAGDMMDMARGIEGEAEEGETRDLQDQAEEAFKLKRDLKRRFYSQF